MDKFLFIIILLKLVMKPYPIGNEYDIYIVKYNLKIYIYIYIDIDI